MMSRAYLLLISASALAACADLPEVPAGTCGNLVIESGEDCDGFPDPTHDGAGLTCEQCAYVCDPHATTVACPTGWGCGIDGRCRHGSGMFERATAEPAQFPSATLIAGDHDGDGATDVLGGGDGHVGTLRGVERQLAYAITSTFNADLIAAADLDGDGADEVVWPSLRGGILGIRGGTADSSRPMLALDTFDIDQTAPGDQAAPPLTELVTVKLNNGSVVPYALMPADTGLSWLDLSRAVRGAPTSTAIQGPPTRLLVAVGNIDTALVLRGEEIAIGFLGAMTIYVRRPDFDAFQLITLPAPLVDAPMFGDADSDGFVDLIIPVAGQAVAVAKGDGSALATTAISDARFASPAPPDCGTGTAGTVGAPPRVVADFDGNGITDYATREGIVRGFANGTYCMAFAAPASATSSIAVLDANGDGLLDVATATGVDTKITLLLNQGSGAFAGHSIQVSNVPTALRAGRFDWDAFEDLLVVEGTADGVTHLEIAKGTNLAASHILLTAPDAPQLSSLTSGAYDDDGVEDLVLLGSEVGRDAPYLARVSLLGEGTDFFSQIGASTVGQVTRVLIGSVTGAQGRNDVVVMFANPVDSVTHVWLFPDQSCYLTDRDAYEAAVVDGADALPAVLADVDGDGLDELVTIDAQGLELFDLRDPASASVRVTAPAATALTAVHRAQGDCVLGSSLDTGASLACDLRGAPTSEILSTSPVLGAVSADVDADGEPEALLVRDSDVVTYDLDPVAERATFPLGPEAATSAACLGDVDGDGVDDLAVGTQSSVELYWGVPVEGSVQP
jgi:hypothetical protein